VTNDYSKHGANGNGVKKGSSVDYQEGKYHDKVKIDPFTRKWFYRHQTLRTPTRVKT